MLMNYRFSIAAKHRLYRPVQTAQLAAPQLSAKRTAAGGTKHCCCNIFSPELLADCNTAGLSAGGGVGDLVVVAAAGALQDTNTAIHIKCMQSNWHAWNMLPDGN
jgi:hypothetical protein